MKLELCEQEDQGVWQWWVQMGLCSTGRNIVTLKGNGKPLRRLRRADMYFSKAFLATVQIGGAGVQTRR